MSPYEPFFRTLGPPNHLSDPFGLFSFRQAIEEPIQSNGIITTHQRPSDEQQRSSSWTKSEQNQPHGRSGGTLMKNSATNAHCCQLFFVQHGKYDPFVTSMLFDSFSGEVEQFRLGWCHSWMNRSDHLWWYSQATGFHLHQFHWLPSHPNLSFLFVEQIRVLEPYHCIKKKESAHAFELGFM